MRKKNIRFSEFEQKWEIYTIENSWNDRVILDEPIIGQKLLCHGYDGYGKDAIEKNFIIGQVYIVEKISNSKSSVGKVKFEGIKGYYKLSTGDFGCFDSIDNHPAISRENQINSVLNEGIYSQEKIRRFDLISETKKNKLLVKCFVAALYEDLEASDLETDNIYTSDYNKIISDASYVNTKYELDKKDFEKFGELTIKEMLEKFF
jgi:hypothetical protein